MKAPDIVAALLVLAVAIGALLDIARQPLPHPEEPVRCNAGDVQRDEGWIDELQARLTK